MAGAGTKLSKSMTVADFDAAYFYARDLKVFAAELGISTGNFRKIELEQLIREFLQTGVVPTKKPTLPRKDSKGRDVLAEQTIVVNYVGDKRTKQFLRDLVHARNPQAKDKSGQWYWLNDWRRQQQAAAAVFTYGDIADRLLSLMETAGRLPPIPSARMNNFITDFQADPANGGTSRKRILQAWEYLKASPGPKTYAHYKTLPKQGTTNASAR